MSLLAGEFNLDYRFSTWVSCDVGCHGKLSSPQAPLWVADLGYIFAKLVVLRAANEILTLKHLLMAGFVPINDTSIP